MLELTAREGADAKLRLFADFGPLSKAAIVDVVFVGTQAARILPGFADDQVVDESAYDWSDVPSPAGTITGELDDGLVLLRQRWQDTQTCPDPGVYEVVNSTWREELGLPGPLKHYLVLGHDTYVEAMAEGFEWQTSPDAHLVAGRLP